MSVASEFVPIVRIPEGARSRPLERLAGVTVLHRPSERSVAAPVRLTRRGVAVLAAAVAVLSTVLVGVAWLSAPDRASGPSSANVPDAVTVQPGDSLWSIATQVAPQRDPRAELADLQRLNEIHGTALVPGQLVRTH